MQLTRNRTDLAEGTSVYKHPKVVAHSATAASIVNKDEKKNQIVHQVSKLHR